MITKRCHVCNTVYNVDLPACPTCNETNTEHSTYQTHSDKKGRRGHTKHPKEGQLKLWKNIAVVIAVAAALTLVAWCMAVTV